MKIITLCLLVSLSACASSNVGQRLNVSVVLAASADVLSTEYSKAHAGQEGNSLIGQSLARLLLMKAGMVGVVLAGTALMDQKHPTLAHLTRGIAIGVWSSAAVWNVTRTR